MKQSRGWLTANSTQSTTRAGRRAADRGDDVVVLDIVDVLAVQVTGTVVDEDVEVVCAVRQRRRERAHRVGTRQVTSERFACSPPALPDRLCGVLGRRLVPRGDEHMGAVVSEGCCQETPGVASGAGDSNA